MDYKIIFIFPATMALLLSVMLLTAPKVLIKIGEFFNRSIDSTKYFKNYRVIFGILTTALGGLMMYFVLIG